MLPSRRRPASEVGFEPPSPIVFLTVCTRGRARTLANDEAHDTLRDAWTSATAWKTGRYVILPDHVHLFASPVFETTTLDSWVRFWKTRFRRTYPHRDFAWQRSHWDRRLRSLDSYESKWRYVRESPVRAGLVDRSEDWPYAGEIERLDW